MSDKDAPISLENRMVARHAAEAFGGEARVDEYINDSDTLAIGILYCRDRPSQGVTSYSTIKLSDHPFGRELAAPCDTSATYFPNVLASAAFTILQGEDVYGRGSVLSNLVRQHDPASMLPHLYLAAPSLWAQAPRLLDCGTKQVGWLLAVPISESEHAYLQAHDAQALDRLFQARQTDFSDMARAPAVAQADEGIAP
jgi:hypothetical protein